MKVFKILASWCSRLLLCAIGSAFSVVMPSAADPVMAPAAPKSSLEAMLDTVKKRGVQEQDDSFRRCRPGLDAVAGRSHQDNGHHFLLLD